MAKSAVKVLNIHERVLSASPERVGALIDSLSSREDALWPKQSWPGIEFNRPLSVGAVGGHGPIRYIVEAYIPGRSIRFRFTAPRGFNGYHGYAVVDTDEHTCVLRETLEMTTHGPALLAWPFVFRPMHDALLEDSLALAQASLGLLPEVHPWSCWVRLLRWVLSGGRARKQAMPNRSFQRIASGIR